jgi:tRNA-specific 2-thiouridylase
MNVFVGLSGGVDSAVSAALLQKEGCDVTGVFIRIAMPGYPCTAGEDKIDAQRVAAHLRIPFVEIDLSKEYQEEVFAATVSEFEKGNTPNPDTLCNQKIKFGAFYKFAKSRGADYVATGHYARVRTSDVNLWVGADPEKDQSYFLWMVPEEVLRHTLFPVGGLKKSDVRVFAKKFGLPNAGRKDSQGLCFLGDISVEDMLQRELAPVEGEVLNEAGAVIGKHRGALLYTLGQRHGFTINVRQGETLPHFVVAKDAEKNTITVSTSPFPRGVSKTRLGLSDTNWIGPYFAEATKGKQMMARFRYRQKLIPAEVRMSGDTAEVILQEPHYAPVGQSLVLYDKERCLGGGIIKSVQLT